MQESELQDYLHEETVVGLVTRRIFLLLMLSSEDKSVVQDMLSGGESISPYMENDSIL